MQFKYLDNKAFFLPLAMTFIMIFTSIMIFIVFQSMNNIYLLESYEDEVYYEVGILKAKKYIDNYVGYSSSYEDTCKQEEYIYKVNSLNVEVSPYCFFDVKFNPMLRVMQLKGGKNDYKISEEEYEKVIEKLQIYNQANIKKLEKFLIKKIKKHFIATEFTGPEGIVIMQAIKKKIDDNIKYYIAFDTTVSIKNTKHKILYIYDYEKNEGKTLRYR